MTDQSFTATVTADWQIERGQHSLVVGRFRAVVNDVYGDGQWALYFRGQGIAYEIERSVEDAKRAAEATLREYITN